MRRTESTAVGASKSALFSSSSSWSYDVLLSEKKNNKRKTVRPSKTERTGGGRQIITEKCAGEIGVGGGGGRGVTGMPHFEPGYAAASYKIRTRSDKILK